MTKVTDRNTAALSLPKPATGGAGPSPHNERPPGRQPRRRGCGDRAPKPHPKQKFRARGGRWGSNFELPPFPSTQRCLSANIIRSKLQSSIFEALACCHSDTVTQITENRVGEVSFEFFRLEFFSERTARTKRIKTGHRSPAGGVSIGPSALDRRTGAVRSCVRSRCIAGSPRGALRRHHCRPPARCAGFWHVSASAAGAAAGQHESRPAVPPAQGAAARAGSPIEPGRTGA
jgi:hypothetical protein